MIVKISLALVGLVALGLSVASVRADVLNDELARLLASHPQILARKAEVAARAEGVQGALSGYLPSVTASSDYGLAYINSQARRSINGEASSGPQLSGTLDITQNIFDGFATRANHQTALVNLQLARVSLVQTTQGVLREGIQFYLDVIRRRELVQLAAGNESTIQLQLNLEDERVQRGAGITVDVLLAKSRLQASKERRVAFEGQLENAISRYTQAFDGLPHLDNLAVPALPTAALPSTLADAVQIALAESPQVMAGNRNVDLADLRKDSARAGYWPTVDVVAEARFERDVGGVTGKRNDYTLLVQASWELFSGYATRSAVAEASYDHKARLDDLIFANRKVVEDVKLSWQNLITARDRVALLENAAAIAGEVHDSFRALRDAGQATVFEVLDAENEVFDARINAANAAFDARVAVYQLLNAIGGLNKEALSVNLAGPTESLAALADELAFLEDSDPNAIDLADAVARARQINARADAQTRARADTRAAPRAEAPAERLVLAQAQQALPASPGAAPRAGPNGVTLVAEVPAVPVPRVQTQELAADTVFISSDGHLLDDPNFQRKWSFDRWTGAE